MATTSAILGLLVGGAFGAVMASGRACFNAGLRQAAFEARGRTLRIFAVALGVQLVLVSVLFAAGVAPVVANVEAGAPALLPFAQLAGGLAFGAGMALAGGCVSGILWKTGAGSVATALAIAGFAAGELLIRGPGSELLVELGSASEPSASSLPELTGLPYELLAPLLGLLLVAALVRRGRDGVAFGVAAGAVAVLAWLAADAAGYGYGLGFVGAADGMREALSAGSPLPYQAWLALGVIGGAALAIRGPLRLPDTVRSARAVGGGLLMGVGGSVALGCNIGHGLTGLGLLSLGSLLAVAAMAGGALATARFVLRPLPRVRGLERPPAPDW